MIWIEQEFESSKHAKVCRNQPVSTRKIVLAKIYIFLFYILRQSSMREQI